MLKDKELKDRIIEDHEGSSANSDMTLDRLRGRIEKIAAANSVPVDLAIDELRIGNALSNTTGTCCTTLSTGMITSASASCSIRAACDPLSTLISAGIASSSGLR